MTARYLLCPGPVRSRADGQVYHIGAAQLANLYGVSMAECVVLTYGGTLLNTRDRRELVALTPRANGDYGLPAVPALPANPYTCHNRAPYKPVVELGVHSFPFRMAMDCRYTLSALGQADPRCAGCKWRADLPQTHASS